jgi:hypothetical protein
VFAACLKAEKGNVGSAGRGVTSGGKCGGFLSAAENNRGQWREGNGQGRCLPHVAHVGGSVGGGLYLGDMR